MLFDLFDFFLINGDAGDHESADNFPSNKSREEESHQANVTLLL